MKKYPKYFTVKDLKELLNNIPDDLPIGCSGHFGEFHAMDENDFRISLSQLRPLAKNGDYTLSWRHMDEDKSPIFSIVSPNIGDEPD